MISQLTSLIYKDPIVPGITQARGGIKEMELAVMNLASVIAREQCFVVSVEMGVTLTSGRSGAERIKQRVLFLSKREDHSE